MKTKKEIKYFLIAQFLIFLFTSCNNQQADKEVIQMEDGSILIPINNVPIKTVNMTDDNGLKQGTWQEDDREEGKAVYSITKEYNFKNDTLHGYYLEYKPKSDDTLVFGNYFHGKRHGEWKFWARDKNEVEKVEIYKNGEVIK